MSALPRWLSDVKTTVPAWVDQVAHSEGPGRYRFAIDAYEPYDLDSSHMLHNVVFTVGGDSTELVLMALHSRYADLQAAGAARIIAGGADARLTEHLLGTLGRMAKPTGGILGQYLAADSFGRYWRCYKRLGEGVRTAAGKALLKLDRHVAVHLAGRLVGRDVNDQVQATQMVRQIGLADQFADSLCRLARQGDRVVRSAAAAALGDAKGYDPCSTLVRCMGDADSRVQANAVEALARMGGDSSSAMDKVTSRHNRVRANAIKWLLETGNRQGEMALAAMLTDHRPAHRASALWVVRTLHHLPADTILRRLALEDEDTKIRARAASTLRSLHAVPAEEVTA